MRYARHWVEDITWHRHMFDQSYFQWGPDEALEAAVRFTRGRVVHETPRHLGLLDQQLGELIEYTQQVEDGMALFLAEGEARRSEDWATALQLMGMTQRKADEIRWRVSHSPAVPNAEVDQALKGWPLPNPYSQVWELRQAHAMWSAAVDILEDTVCDLVSELAPRHGWVNLAFVTSCRSGEDLEDRVRHQRARRGLPGDERRVPRQVWDGWKGNTSAFTWPATAGS